MRSLIIVLMFVLSVFFMGCGDDSTAPGPPVMPAYNGTAFYGDGMTENCDAFINGINRGVAGHTSGMMLGVIESNLAEDVDKRYHILIGLNDAIGDMRDAYINSMGYALNLLKGNAVIVTSILPTYHGDYNARILDFNSELSAIAAEHYNVVYRDVADDFTEPPFSILNTTYSDDGLNLNAAGCQKLYEGL